MSVLTAFRNSYLKTMNSDLSLVETESNSGPLRTKIKFDRQLFAQFPFQISSIYGVPIIRNSMEQCYFSEDNDHSFGFL
jgi:hypothetical protein